MILKVNRKKYAKLGVYNESPRSSAAGRFIFLKEELKKIDKQIKAITYGGTKDSIEADIKLWELREMIIKEILRY